MSKLRYEATDGFSWLLAQALLISMDCSFVHRQKSQCFSVRGFPVVIASDLSSRFRYEGYARHVRLESRTRPFKNIFTIDLLCGGIQALLLAD